MLVLRHSSVSAAGQASSHCQAVAYHSPALCSDRSTMSDRISHSRVPAAIPLGSVPAASADIRRLPPASIVRRSPSVTNRPPLAVRRSPSPSARRRPLRRPSSAVRLPPPAVRRPPPAAVHRPPSRHSIAPVAVSPAYLPRQLLEP